MMAALQDLDPVMVASHGAARQRGYRSPAINAGYRILVASAEVEFASGTARLLESAGYAAFVAFNGEDAWQLACDQGPDLLLLDRDLPGIDGLELCRQIKKSSVLPGTLVVLVSTAYVECEDQVHGLEAGADGYMARPLAGRELLARVSAFVRILKLSRTLEAQTAALQLANETALQSQVATLNLLEDARDAQQRAERAQRALAHSTQMLEVTGAMARIGGWELDLQTRKLTWTRESFRIHEREPPEPTVAELIDAYLPEARPLAAAAVRAAIDRGTPFGLDLPRRTRDGQLRWVHVQGQAEMEGGRALRMYGTFQDISARRAAEEALIASEARARAVLDASPVPMALNDAQQRITFLNPAFTSAFGYLPEDLRNLDEWWPKAYPDVADRDEAKKAWFDELARARQSGEPFRPIEVQIRCKNGASRSVLISDEPLSLGQDGSHLVTLLDVTERKRMERQVLQSEKLASIGLLAAGIAHEINNPIGFVNSNMGSLRRLVGDLLKVIDAFEAVQATGTPSPEHWATVDDVKARTELHYLREDLPALLTESEEGLRRVTRIVKGLREFAHTSAVDTWQPDDLIQGLESTLNVVWNELKYTCEVRREYVQLPPVDCVLSQINQVFMNLMVNAAQAIEGKGVITLRTGCAGDEVWVEIADTGRGISAEEQMLIFDPFFTTKTVGSGTGLGLSISHGIIERHHGRIEVKSELGKGTAMRVWLPVRQPG